MKHTECIVCHEMRPKTYTCKEQGCPNQLCPRCYGVNRTRCPSCKKPWSGKAVQITSNGGLTAEIEDMQETLRLLNQLVQNIETRLEVVESAQRSKKPRGGSGVTTTL